MEMETNTLADVGIALRAHETKSQSRYERMMDKMCSLATESHKEDDTMGAREDLNIIGVPNMGGNTDGLGLGGGLIGGVLLGALLGRNGGLFGGNNDSAGAVSLQGSIDTNAIMEQLSNLNAAVPLSQAQVQLTVANAAASLGNQATALAGQTSAQLFQGQLATAQGFAATKDSVDALSTQVAVGLGNVSRELCATGWTLSQAISNDGDKTRAMLTAQNDATLNRIIVTQAAELAELRNESSRASDRHGIEINMINNQNQNQLQFQQQAQVLGQLAHALADVSQVARATNSTVMVGNTGTTSARQTANPTNVQA